VSIVIAGFSLILVLASARFTDEVGATASLRTRAQTAADAAALAAVAESGPSGGGDPTGAARRFATINGGRVVECLCPPGATAMQVRVESGGVIADARAVLDPNALFPLNGSFDAGGLDPRLAGAVARLVEATHGAVRVVSGYRSTAEQSRLWNDALTRYGEPEAADDWVAPPGSSMHERGLAVDLGGDLRLAVATVDRLGLPLWRPLTNEPWHFELVGSRG
jgi:D-alanyl-D-alanine carboxypeptidase-like protein/putative Flp pilus-assembly TadE/G-like protein